MVEPGGSDIENREQLVAWLEDKPPDWAVATTARIALRVVPFVWAVEREGSLDRVTNRRMTLTTLRATAISWFAIANRTRGIATAAVADATAIAAYASEAAVIAAAFDDNADWRNVAADAGMSERTQDVTRLAISPLWPEGPRNRSTKNILRSAVP
jgi:hypothetical protein